MNMILFTIPISGLAVVVTIEIILSRYNYYKTLISCLLWSNDIVISKYHKIYNPIPFLTYLTCIWTVIDIVISEKI